MGTVPQESRSNPLTRRAFLVGAAALVVAACSGDDATDDVAPARTPTTTPPPAPVAPATTAAPTTTIPVPEIPGPPFALGVASGDPLPDAVVLWTRLAPDPRAPDGAMPDEVAPVAWELAADENFASVVATGVAVAEPAYAHSVHVDVTGLDAATTYWYRFRIGDHESPVGRTRTAPAAGAEIERVRLAVANCQAYQSGFFAAHGDVAGADLDAVLFVGDYIYELESSLEARRHGLDPPQDLAGFRVMYGVYKADEHLRAAHAAHPWIVTWDDHEVEDNYGGRCPGGIGRTLNPNAEAEFPAKRAAAYQAWWEHQPVRAEPPAADGSLQVYRSFAFGDLVAAPVLDNRQYRDPIPPDAGAGALPRPFGGGPQIDAAFDPDRSMLGAEQEAWLADELRASTATWNLIVQQTIVAEVDRRPDLPDAGYSMDGWDGYVANRNRLLGLVAETPVRNVVTVGGDIHTAAVADLKPDYEDPGSPIVGTDLVAPSISALELIEAEALEGSRSNPHIHYYEPTRRGWLLLDFTPAQLRAEFRFVADALDPQSPVAAGSTWVVDDGVPGARPA